VGADQGTLGGVEAPQAPLVPPVSPEEAKSARLSPRLIQSLRKRDLGGGEPAPEPVEGLARRLLGRHRPDPRVQRDLISYAAAQQEMDRKTQHVRFQIPERHLDQRLGLEPVLDGRVHRGEEAADY
jgi:hypothetical protein